LIFFTQTMPTTVFGLAMRFFTFGTLAVSPLGLAVAFSFRCQPAYTTAVTLSAPAATADIKNKMTPTAADLT
jgi:hypothetical protein